MEETKEDPVVGKTIKPPRKVKLITDFPLDKELFIVAEILVKLRFSTRRWEEIYGADARTRKKLCEDKADEWIEQHVTME